MPTRTPRRPLAPVIGVLVAALFPATAHAATLILHAVAKGEAVPEARIMARCEGGDGWSARSDDRGFAVVAVPRCELSLRVEAEGRTPLEGTVAPGRLADGAVLLVLSDGWSAEPAVSESGLALRRLDLGETARYERDGTLVAGIPLSADPWSILETVEPAGVTDRIDGAGLFLAEPARFAMRGASWTQNVIELDGLDITDWGRGGTPLGYPAVGSLGAIDVTSALAPVEQGAPGVSLSLVPRSPGAHWRGTADAAAVFGGLQSGGAAGGLPPVARFGSLADVDVTVGGPLSRGAHELRGLFAARAGRARRVEWTSPEVLSSRVASLFAELTARRGDRNQVRLLASADDLRVPFPGRASFFDRSVSERRGTLGAGLRWEHAARALAWSVAIGGRRGTDEPSTTGEAAGRPVERLLDGPIPDQILPAHSRTDTWTLGAGLALRGARVGGLWHAPRFGARLEGASVRERAGPEATVPETVAGLPARVWDYTWGGSEARRHLRDLAAWAADRIVLRDRLLVEAGVRLETSTGRAEGAAQGVSWTTLSPRVSARLRVAGRVYLLGGYGEYQHRLLLEDLAFGDPGGPSADVYRWNDRNGDLLFQDGERGPVIARVGPGSPDGTLVRVDPDLRPPRSREVVVGAEAGLGAWTLRLTAYDRRERDLIETVNLGAPAEAYAVRLIPDPSGDILGTQDDQLLAVYDRLPASFGQDRYLLTNPEGDTGRHRSVELRLERRGPRLAVLFGGTAGRTDVRGANVGFRVDENDQGLVGELYDEPNATTNSYGRSFFDRAFTLKIAAAWRAPWGLGLGAVARYQDGQPFGRVVVVPDLGQGPEAIPATPRGQIVESWALDAQGRYIVPSGHRFTNEITVDLRVEKRFALGRGCASLRAEVFNLLDLRHEVEEDIVWGPGFRRPTTLQPPRAVRVGVRLEF